MLGKGGRTARLERLVKGQERLGSICEFCGCFPGWNERDFYRDSALLGVSRQETVISIGRMQHLRYTMGKEGKKGKKGRREGDMGMFRLHEEST
jgi:hypothetical protein